MTGLFRRYVLHNFWIKLLSIVLATGLWLYVSPDEQPAEVAVRAPIEFLHVPAHLEISNESIPEAQIRVRGPERVIRRLVANDVHAEIDLSDAKPGERTFDLTSQQVHHPTDIRVVQVVPSQVHIAFDTRLTREVDITPRVTGVPAAQTARYEVYPQKVTITGPKRHVELVDAATTDPVDVSGALNRVSFVTNVYVADPLVQVVQPTAVRVTVILQKMSIEPVP